jgi:hypothetical protein
MKASTRRHERLEVYHYIAGSSTNTKTTNTNQLATLVIFQTTLRADDPDGGLQLRSRPALSPLVLTYRIASPASSNFRRILARSSVLERAG